MAALTYIPRLRIFSETLSTPLILEENLITSEKHRLLAGSFTKQTQPLQLLGFVMEQHRRRREHLALA